MWGKKEEEKIIITIKSHIAELEKLKKKSKMLNVKQHTTAYSLAQGTELHIQ